MCMGCTSRAGVLIPNRLEVRTTTMCISGAERGSEWQAEGHMDEALDAPLQILTILSRFFLLFEWSRLFD